ncbi:MAG: DNA mismatch repair protein MutS [Clostridia bacterium]|nr:DNA mismatch repair protein MutS [Clostridia bacterium]
MAAMTPMMQQYLAIKEQYPQCILFFRLGDFYEMFFEDAKVASRELELVLTGRDCGQEERAPMCGVPYHSCETYIARLVNRGYKVAICEQTEDPALAKGLVQREVVRIITPGTVIEGSMLEETRNNYLCTVFAGDGFTDAGLCFTDTSTGDIHVTHLDGTDIRSRLINELSRFSPREVLLNDVAMADQLTYTFLAERLLVKPEQAEPASFDYAAAEEIILQHFHKTSLRAAELEDKFSAVRALGCTLHYLYMTQKIGLERMAYLNVYSDIQYMRLDISTRRNLELTETLRSGKKHGSLLGVLDRTRTAMGARLLRSWVEQPLLHPAQITRRQGAVDELVHDSMRREELQELLGEVYDLKRIMSRVVYGSVNAKELCSLKHTIGRLGPVRERMQGAKSTLLCELREQIDPLQDVYQRISEAVADDPPLTVKEGGVIRPGYNAELDELRSIMTDGTGIIARIEAEEKEKTGIRTLKVGYNRVFGYYIEVSRSFTEQVPEHYIRKQTLANAERYITQELKELEARVLGAKERSIALEHELFSEVRRAVAAELSRIQSTAEAVSAVDVLCSLAEVAVRGGYVCPVIDMSGELVIKNGRHPVVESLLKAPFVPNDIHLDGKNERVMILTGPNMAGKSTYMRQTALITLLAQIGSFVPAESATIGIVDSIFTRVGASDDLASGQSTFMVEMSEVATILEHATANSLIVFDEIGRGTSTFDGMSIARAVLEHVARRVGAKTLFATHYHELTVMEDQLEGVRNYSIAVKRHGESITFLRRIVRGPADESYGIEVAKLAGVPDAVVARAREILEELNAGGAAAVQRAPLSVAEDNEQLSLLPMADNELVRRLRDLDVNVLTPIEAMHILYELNRDAQAF